MGGPGAERAHTALETVVREEWGRLAAQLLAHFRRIDLVEDALADAIEAAARTWPLAGVPDSPAAWLNTTARRRLIDRLRAEAMAARKEALLVTEAARRSGGQAMADPGDLVEDDLLRLVLMCTHPALTAESASALALRLVLGISTADLARLFLVSESTMAARLTRAKRKIVTAGIPFAVPDAQQIPDRLATVAQTAYLAFTAGYAPASGPDPLRVELAGEAIRLVRVVIRVAGREPTLVALLALMLLQHSRRDARQADDGSLVLLTDQDRSRWHHDEIAEALALMDTGALAAPLPPQAASYLIQAAIAAEHATAATPSAARWDRIVSHYDALVRLDPSPSAQLARAVAVSEAHGPAAGLAAVDAIEFPGSHRLPAVRADLLRRLGDDAGARDAYDEAIAMCRNESELAHLRAQRSGLRPQPARG